MTETNLITWPERPTVHGDPSQGGIFKIGRDVHWRERDLDGTAGGKREAMSYGYPFRTCSYCGSIHPEDLIEWLDKGAKLGGSDWKYGWPHKFYVSGIANPLAGTRVKQGASMSSDLDRLLQDEKVKREDVETHTTVTIELVNGVEKSRSERVHYEVPMFGTASSETHAKWYNEHIGDEMSDAARAKLIDYLSGSGIKFDFKDGKIGYAAPYAGYQR